MIKKKLSNPFSIKKCRLLEVMVKQLKETIVLYFVKENEKEKDWAVFQRLNYNIEASTNTKNIKMFIKRTIHYLLYLLSGQYHQM